jgi:hypothetical protein
VRIRIALSPGGVWKVQRRTFFGSWCDVGGDELAYSRVINPMGLWWFATEDEALVVAEKFKAYWDRPITDTQAKELPSVARGKG